MRTVMFALGIIIYVCLAIVLFIFTGLLLVVACCVIKEWLEEWKERRGE